MSELKKRLDALTCVGLTAVEHVQRDAIREFAREVNWRAYKLEWNPSSSHPLRLALADTLKELGIEL